jgi:glycosyltransferase involved in cell wall biosynthesis
MGATISMKKIIVKGPALSQTGYGEQTRFVLRALRSRPDLFDIYLLNLEWGKSNHIIEDDNEHAWLVETIRKTAKLLQANQGRVAFDLSLQVTIPNEFEKMAPVNIGYTAGIETTKVAPQWLQKCNEVMDKIIVISKHSKDVFVNTVVEAQDLHGNKFPYKLEKPIEYITYPVKPDNTQANELELEHEFNFLMTSQWCQRKNFENAIRWFVEENIDQEVGLVVKTNSYKNCTIDRDFTHKRLQALLAPYKDRKCSVTLLHGYMNEAEMQGLYRHENIKAFINIAHGEGFGLPLFDAAAAGLPIITIGWSGQCDFLFMPEKNKKGKEKKKGKFLKVDFDILPVQREAHWEGVIQPDSQWAFAKEGSYKMALRKMKSEHHVYKGMANSLKEWVCKVFTQENQNARFVELIGVEDEASDLDDWLSQLEGEVEIHT